MARTKGSTIVDDRDVLDVEAHHPIAGTMRYEKVRLHYRNYYRLTTNGKRGGALTDLDHARLTIAYWRIKGWI